MNARDFSVKDRVLIITGAGQGIGREFAGQFAAAGAIPIVADQNLRNAQRVEREIEQSSGRSVAFEVGGDRTSLDAMVSEVLNRFGRIDVLINNAAIFAALQKRPFDEIPLEEWNKVLHVNVTGTFLSISARGVRASC